MKQEGASEVSTARKLGVMLNYVFVLSDYVSNLSDHAGTSNVSKNACIALCLL